MPNKNQGQKNAQEAEKKGRKKSTKPESDDRSERTTRKNEPSNARNESDATDNPDPDSVQSTGEITPENKDEKERPPSDKNRSADIQTNTNRGQENVREADEKPDSTKAVKADRSVQIYEKVGPSSASHEITTDNTDTALLHCTGDTTTPKTKDDKKRPPSDNREESSDKKMKILCWDDAETKNFPKWIEDFFQIGHLEPLSLSHISETEQWKTLAIDNSSPILLYLPTDISPDVQKFYMDQKDNTTKESYSGPSEPPGRSKDPPLRTPMECKTSISEKNYMHQSSKGKDEPIGTKESYSGPSEPPGRSKDPPLRTPKECKTSYGENYSTQQSSKVKGKDKAPPQTSYGENYSTQQSSKVKGKDKAPPQTIQRRVIGIFSRSAERDYSWLKTLLVKNGKNVESFYIATKTLQKFREDIKKCNFGILYHSGNSGRLNITNVTDSMYDNHLKCMSDHLGKENVMVVLDDLQDSTDMEKKKILSYQPTVGECAGHLKLINFKEKDTILTSQHSAKAKEILDCFLIEDSKSRFSWPTWK